MNIKDFFRNHWLIILIVFVSLVCHLVFFFDWHQVWWDSGVYIGMGKFIFSLGKIGLWEHIRPLSWPIILGFIWKLSLPVVFFGKVIQLLMFLSSVILVYLIGKKIYSKSAGLLASSFLAASTILFFLSFHLYTEIPAMFFTLLAYFFFLEKKYLISGLFAAVTFLTKFPAGMFLVILFVFLLFKKEKKNIFDFVIGTAVVLLPFFLSNIIFYGTLSGGLIAAQAAIKNVLGCNVLRPQPWYYYFFVIFFYENKFILASIIGIFNKTKRSFLIIVSAVLPLLYFMNLHCRDYRYLVVFLPFVALLGGAGLDFLLKRLKGKKVKNFLLIALIIAVSFTGYKNAFIFYNENEQLSPIAEEQGYFSYLDNVSVKGAVWTSNPVLSAYSDDLFNKIYYPIYDADISKDFFDYLSADKDRVEFVFLDNCGGGIICHPEDEVCEEKNEELMGFLEENFDNVYNKTHGRCWYKIYKNPIF